LFSSGEDGTIRRFDLATRRPAAGVELGIPVHSLALSGERLLAGTSDGRIVTLDARTLAVRAERRAHSGAVRALQVLPDGRIASGGEDDSVALFRPDLEREIFRYLHADFVRALVPLPDGSLLSGSYDGTLRRYAPVAA
jgi:cytochrome c